MCEFPEVKKMLPFLFDELRKRWIISTVCFLALMGSLLPWATAQEPWWTKWTKSPGLP